MADKNFKLGMRESEDLIWAEILQESKENFTDEFQVKVIEIIRKIREEAD